MAGWHSSSVIQPVCIRTRHLFYIILGTYFTVSSSSFSLASEFTFNWPAPSHFTVKEILNAKGNTLEYLYDFDFIKTNDEFILQCNNARIIAYNGQKLTSQELEVLGPVVNMNQYPPLRINSDGIFIETLQAADAVARAQKGLDKAFPNRPQDTKVGLPKFYESQAGKKMLNQIYGNIWTVWVEAWINLNLKEGESVSTNEDLATGEDVSLPAKEVWTNTGFVKGETNLVCLKFRETARSKDLAAMLKPYTDVIATNSNSKPADPLPSGISFERSIIMEVHTDPNTLQPIYAREAITSDSKPPGEDEIIDTQTHVYTFNWDKQ
jgi:hypothetical protein